MNFQNVSDAPFATDVSEGITDVSAYWVKTKDGKRVRVVCWAASKAKHGTVFLLPGRTENVEKYGRTAARFVEEGLAVVALDWRGQGLSDRLTKDSRMSHVRRYSDYQYDLEAMISLASGILGLGKPWYLVGHSLGAGIALRHLLKSNLFSACAFTGPLWGVNLPTLQWTAAWPLSLGAQIIGLGHRYCPGADGSSYVLSTVFADNRLTNDISMYEYYRSITRALPDQVIGGPSLQWLFQTLRETMALSKLPSPSLPCLTFLGDNDEMISKSAVAQRMSSWPLGKLKLIQQAKHDLMCETPEVRDHVFSSMVTLFKNSA